VAVRQTTQRQLTVQYAFRVSACRYREETIFGWLSEVRPTQSFDAFYNTRRRWGSAAAELLHANSVDDLHQNRLQFERNLNFRVTGGADLTLALLRREFATSFPFRRAGP
jgi:hypothetical protein